jgi:hypothetical protein
MVEQLESQVTFRLTTVSDSSVEVAMLVRDAVPAHRSRPIPQSPAGVVQPVVPHQRAAIEAAGADWDARSSGARDGITPQTGP